MTRCLKLAANERAAIHRPHLHSPDYRGRAQIIFTAQRTGRKVLASCVLHGRMDWLVTLLVTHPPRRCALR
jgi:hypothetical protein